MGLLYLYLLLKAYSLHYREQSVSVVQFNKPLRKSNETYKDLWIKYRVWVLNVAVQVVVTGILKGLKTRKNHVFLLGRLLTLEVINSLRPKEDALHLLSIRCF